MATTQDIQNLIKYSAAEANILPITSLCDSRCVFCSHRNNPPDIKVYSIGVRSLEEITETIPYLDPRRVITIGESATNIIEGEPFTHPSIRDIIVILRNSFKHTPIEITTNGHHLSEDMVRFIKKAGNITLSISLNSASAAGRRLLMGDTEAQTEQTLSGIGYLRSNGVAFQSSLVAMPHITGWDDLRSTINFLAENNASVIRVFAPSFSSRASAEIATDNSVWAELKEFIRDLPRELPCPVLLEPSLVSDLIPNISGVFLRSPAWNAGIRRGDIFLSINGRCPRCRVEAWNMLEPSGAFQVSLLRDGQPFSASWHNAFAGGSGITMEYDFDPSRAEAILNQVNMSAGKSLLLTSEFAYDVICAVLGLLELSRDRAEPFAVKNVTFGGSIKAAGLLTVDDYCKSFDSWLKSHTKPAQLLLPLESFDSLGLDLKRKSYNELSERAGIPVFLV